MKWNEFEKIEAKTKKDGFRVKWETIKDGKVEEDFTPANGEPAIRTIQRADVIVNRIRFAIPGAENITIVYGKNLEPCLRRAVLRPVSR